MLCCGSRLAWQGQPCRVLWPGRVRVVTRATREYQSFTQGHTSGTASYSSWYTPLILSMMVRLIYRLLLEGPITRHGMFIRHTPCIWLDTFTKRWDMMFNRIRTKRRRTDTYRILLLWSVSSINFEGGDSLWATPCIWIMSFIMTIVTYIPPNTFSILWVTTFIQYMTQMKW